MKKYCCRQDVLASETETFIYDFLDRLTGASSTSYSETFTYDEIGNMTSMDGDTYSYGQNGAGPHAVTAIGSTNYTYDDNGNMTARQEVTGSPASGPTATVTITATPVQAPVATATVRITATPVAGTSTNHTWDVENRLVSTSGGASFVYDGDGNRIKKTEGGETILYVNKYYEKNLTTGIVTTNYYLDSKLIATREDSTLTYVHQDALTGTSVTTNSSGTSTGSIKYFSFGSVRSGTVTTTQKFTGQRLDSTGLYYYGARYYDPSIGRFISPDTIISDPANPQSLNRYSYCINNPLKYIDPSGHTEFNIVNEGINDNGEVWYCIYNGNNLIGIQTGYENAQNVVQQYATSNNIDTSVDKQNVNYSVDYSSMDKQRGSTAWQLSQNEKGTAMLSIFFFGILGIAGGFKPSMLPSGKTAVIGKMADLNKPGVINSNEYKLSDYLPDQGSYTANWAQNKYALSEVMKTGKPIRDLTIDEKGYLINKGGFLEMERNYLKESGWTYSNQTHLWSQPK